MNARNLPTRTKGLRGLARAVGIGLVGAAVIHEMRKPAAERTWHGHLWGRVPYEFRLPTRGRLRAAYWAPDDSHVFTDTPFGVGWSVNVGRLMRVCSRSCRGGLRHGPAAAA